MSLLYNQKCSQCKDPIKICDSCADFVCLHCDKEDKDKEDKEDKDDKRPFPTQCHAPCAECKNVLVCHINGVCGMCQKPYHYITDCVAIGNSSTPYDRFDIVINMDCPNNGISPGKMDYSYLKESDTHLIRCGIQDCPLDEYSSFATQIFDEINRVINVLKENGKKCKEKGVSKDKKGHRYPLNPRILFHCYAGVSRSSTAAIYYLAKDTGFSTKAIYDMVKEKRKIIRPNSCFMKILGIEKV